MKILNIFSSCMFFALIGFGSLSMAENINQMKSIEVLQLLETTNSEEKSTQKYEYKKMLVGKSLTEKGVGICEFNNISIIGEHEFSLQKGDGTSQAVKIPLIENYSRTGVCLDLKIAYFKK